MMSENNLPVKEAERFTGIFQAKVSLRGDAVMHTVSVDMDDAYANKHMVPHLKKMFIEVLNLSGGSDAYDLYGVDGTCQLFIPDEEKIVNLLKYISKGSFLMTPRI